MAKTSILSILLLTMTTSLAAQEPYTFGPDSERQPDVPQGEVHEHSWRSEVFPGTIRRFWVYVPAQYDGTSDAAVMVFQDGHAYVGEGGDFRVPIVFDNLIHQGAMPVTIGIFIDPGHLKDALPDVAGWRPRPENRSFEYDTLSNQYARMLLEEILPEVSKEYRLSADPENRAICGISSGGICAFTVAWERPDEFRKVLSHVGSFTNIASGEDLMSGGHNYPALIRKADRRPIRVYLQDGENDLDNAHGSWPLANQQMAAALKYAGYDYKFVYGVGGAQRDSRRGDPAGVVAVVVEGGGGVRGGGSRLTTPFRMPRQGGPPATNAYDGEFRGRRGTIRN